MATPNRTVTTHTLSDHEITQLLAALLLEQTERRERRSSTPLATAVPSTYRPPPRSAPSRELLPRSDLAVPTTTSRFSCGAPNVSRAGWCAWDRRHCPIVTHAWHRMAQGERIDLTPCTIHPHRLALRCCTAGHAATTARPREKQPRRK